MWGWWSPRFDWGAGGSGERRRGLLPRVRTQSISLTLRLGFEAGRNHGAELDDYFDGNDETDEGLAAACLLACLDERMGAIRATLTSAFGDDSLLFWSLYRSIWPDLKRSSDENMNGLLSLSDVDMGDIDRPWSFVKDGWIEFAEE